MPRSALLACGVLSSLLYVATDIFGALTWQGYHYASQAISELGAIGAPSRPYVSPLFLAYDLLLIAFGIGVRMGDGRASRLRVTGAALIVVGAVGLVATRFPMQMRGSPPALTDTMHIVLTAVMVLCILLAVGSGAKGFGRRFRFYSFGTILVLLVFGILAALDGPRVAANLATPYLGITERINIGAYLLWVAVLSIALLRSGAPDPEPV